MARYTPGPWRVAEDERPWQVRCPTRGLEDVRDADGLVCAVSYRPNAILIGLAPEMAEILSDAKEILEVLIGDREMIIGEECEVARDLARRVNEALAKIGSV